MNNLKEYINESRLQVWMICSSESNMTYLVSATDLESAKALVAATGVSESTLSGWLISNMIKKVSSPVILVDSDMIITKGDKKY
jgi:hypothetical protein